MFYDEQERVRHGTKCKCGTEVFPSINGFALASGMECAECRNKQKQKDIGKRVFSQTLQKNSEEARKKAKKKGK